MSRHILKCILCQKYTLSETCPSCRARAQETHPPKFSLDDKYGSYRREIKKKEWAGQGLY